MERVREELREQFVLTSSADHREHVLRDMSEAELRKALAELSVTLEAAQTDMIEALNRQLTVSGFLAAIRFELERRAAGCAH